MKVRVIGIDLGKTVFHLIGMDEHGSIVLKKRSQKNDYRDAEAIAEALQRPTIRSG
jgi:transposase